MRLTVRRNGRRFCGVLSVLGYFRIDLVGPGQNAAGEIFYLGEAILLQVLGDLLTAATRLAVDNNLTIAVELADALCNIVLRN